MPVNSTQLDLWQVELDALPWQGRSPRVLTRAYLGVILKPEAQKDDRFFVDPSQVDLFPAAIQELPRYGGAPSIFGRFDDEEV